ncbi:MAG: hypothetical protein ACFFCQ_14135 [Promethearchaeota archaeon]
MIKEFLIVQAQLDGFEWKAFCPRCKTVLAPTPFNRIHICLQCTQLFLVEFPETDALSLVSFESLMYYQIMKDLISSPPDPSDEDEINRRKEILELLIRLGAQIIIEK